MTRLMSRPSTMQRTGRARRAVTQSMSKEVGREALLALHSALDMCRTIQSQALPAMAIPHA
jgi:hypothetical protein